MNNKKFNIYERLLDKKLIDLDYTDPDIIIPDQYISTGTIITNLAFSGKVDGGLKVGRVHAYSAFHSLCKSMMAKIICRNAQKLGITPVYFDSEFEWDWNLARKLGIDCSKDKLILFQNNQIEEIREKIANIAGGLSLEERRQILFVVDSWGALISYEVKAKALDKDSKLDNSEILKKNNLAKALVGTRSTVFIANHVYEKIGTSYGSPIATSGGSKFKFFASVMLTGTSKAKDEMVVKGEDTLVGAIISAEVEKSRSSREKQKIKIRVKYDGGLDYFYGLLDLALTNGDVVKSGSYYVRPCVKDDKKWLERNIYCADFWAPLLKDPNAKFRKYIEGQFSYTGDMNTSDDIFEEEQITQTDSRNG